jgi:hypothetical protein
VTILPLRTMPHDAKATMAAARLADQSMLTLLAAVITGLWHLVWPRADGRREFMRLESGWAPKPCPCCTRIAVFHGWLYRDPPPRAPHSDERIAVAAVFIHAGAKDCIVESRTAVRTGREQNAASPRGLFGHGG